MNSKKCVFCNSSKVIKKGKQGVYQRWRCKECKKKFQSNRKALPTKEELFYSFTFHKQTYAEIARFQHIRVSKTKELIDSYVLPIKVHNPREVYLEIDATYFGTEENKFCLIVFRDPFLKENLIWRFVDTERVAHYLEMRYELEDLGYVILSITADGLPLFRRVFKDIPYQMCLIHMERIIIRGTTRKPKLEAGIALLSLAKSLPRLSEKRFKDYMNKYTLRYFHFLNERTHSELTGEWWYTHEKLREAFLSLQNLSEYLFTYTRDANIQSNTNSIEGMFGNIKKKVKVHNGLSVSRKKRLIEILLINGSSVFAYEK